MEKEFTTDNTWDLKTYKEFSKGYKQTDNKFFVISLIMIAYLVINLLDKQYRIVIYFSIIYAIVMVVKVFLSSTKIGYKRMIMSNNGKIPQMHITINKEGINVKGDNGNKSDYSFENIISVAETKNFIILKLKYNLGIIVNKNKLKGGTKEELYEFLLLNCTNIKRKKIHNARKGFYRNLLYFTTLLIIFLISLCLDVKSNNTANHIMWNDIMVNKITN